MDSGLTGEFRRFYELPFIGMAVTSPTSKHWLHVNQALCDILGYSREELVTKTWAELTHPEDLAADIGHFERVLRGETDGYKLDKRFFRKDGTVIYASIEAIAERRPDGVIDRFYATVADITQRKRAEEALRASADLLANLARQVPGVIYQYRVYPDGRSCFPFASEAIRDIYEVTPEEVREDASVVFSRVHPDDLVAGVRSIEESARTLTPWEWEFRVVLPRQGLRWRSGIARPERLPDGGTLWHGFISDSTERQLAQQESLRLKAAIAESINGIAVADLDGQLTYVNKAFLSLWGHRDTHEVVGRHATEFWRSPELAAKVITALQARGSDSGEMTALRTDGSERIFQFNANLFPGPDGTPAGLMASFLDITDRKVAEAELRLKDETIASSLNGIAITDADGMMVYVNPAFLRMWGYAHVDEVVGLPAIAFAQEGEADRLIDLWSDKGEWRGDIAARRKDGSRFDVMLSANVVRDDAGNVQHVMGSLLDLTEPKRLQAQLLQSQKMQSVGRLAGGVAHDFNNLLTVMKGYLDLAQLDLPAESALARDLAEVDRAVDSAAGLTQQLLAFSRKQIIDPRVLDLNASVMKMHAMLSRLLGENIELRQATSPDLGRVRFDPTQAEQILVNLAVNARDAMPNGGQLTLQTANVTLDAQYAAKHPDAAPGEYVMLSVSDTGTGMSDEVKAHLFEPFFTTKETGHGTGLGLAMVFGAVTQNHGLIEVDSELGQGTTIKLFLPCVQPEETPQVVAATGDLPHGTELIVFVEDEDAIRAMAVRLLSKLGYHVLPFGTGESALQAMSSMTERIDLLLTDVIMPGMSGRELADHVRALRPDIRILFASGYTEDVIARQGILEAGIDFLPKPYSTSDLAHRVRAALDRAAPQGQL